MRKQNTVFVKDVNVPSLKIRMRRKIIGNEKADSRMEWQAMFPLKALMRKTASKCLLVTWSERKFNITKMSSYLKLLTALNNLT
jgi:hypothetical protein